MATIQNEMVVIGLSGMVGKQLAIHRNHEGQPEICALDLPLDQSGHCDAPDSHHRHLYEALLYSRSAPAVPYDEVTKSPPELHTRAVLADIIHPPEINRIDISKYSGLVGDTICVTAGDDTYVASVGLMIVTDAGVLVEKGSARVSERNPYLWTYVATANAASRFVKIVADVADISPREDSAATVN